MKRLRITQLDMREDRPREVYRYPVVCTLHTADDPSETAAQRAPAAQLYRWLVLPENLELPGGERGPLTLGLRKISGSQKTFRIQLPAHEGRLDVRDPTDVRLSLGSLCYSGYLDL